jgi:hypothetical protein
MAPAVIARELKVARSSVYEALTGCKCFGDQQKVADCLA